MEDLVSITENVKERLDACLMESENPNRIAGAILYEFKIHELEMVIAKLVHVYDKAPNLLHEFWQRSSDACPLDSSESELQEKEWFNWIYKNIRS